MSTFAPDRSRFETDYISSPVEEVGYAVQVAETTRHARKSMFWRAQKNNYLDREFCRVYTSLGDRRELPETANISTTNTFGVITTPSILQAVNTAIPKLHDSKVRQQARLAVSRLRRAMKMYSVAGKPDWTLSESEDGSATIEWRLAGRRLAITLEPESEESGWHLVVLPNSSGTHGFLRSGFLREFDPQELIGQFLTVP